MSDIEYSPTPNELQLTLRAVVVGCLLGGMVTIINTYFGLQTGWSFSGALITAILSYAIFAVLPIKTTFSVLENNIAETAGSAASMMTPTIGVITILPALKMLGQPMDLTTLYLWSFSVGLLGVFIAVPFRRQLIVVEQLRFPTGTAAAEVILAMHHAGRDGLHKAHVLFIWSIVAASYTLLGYFIPALHQVPIFTWLALSFVTSWGFTLFMSPLMLGAGMLIGPRVGSSLFIGALFAWGVLGPIVQHMGWVTGQVLDYKHGVISWVLWPGVALMIADSLASLIPLLFSLVKSSDKIIIKNLRVEETIPKRWWVTGAIISSCCTSYALLSFFAIPIFMSLTAICLSWLLCLIASRALGETDINPISAIAKITQLIFGLLAPKQAITNLMAAGLTGACATPAGDMLEDWKTGYILGASPRKQFIAQLFGNLSGIIFAVPIYLLFDKAYDIGSAQMPAPAAHAWVAMSQVLADGFSTLPPHVGTAVAIALIIGTLLPFLRQIKSISHYVPSGLAMGVAFIIPAYFSITFFIGSMALVLWQKRNAKSAANLAYAVAAGLIVGEGLMGAVVACFKLFGIEPWL